LIRINWQACGVLIWIKDRPRRSPQHGQRHGEVDMSLPIRLLLAVAGAIAVVFVARDVPNFGVLQAFISMLLIVAVVGLLAWLRR